MSLSTLLVALLVAVVVAAAMNYKATLDIAAAVAAARPKVNLAAVERLNKLIKANPEMFQGAISLGQVLGAEYTAPAEARAEIDEKRAIEAANRKNAADVLAEAQRKASKALASADMNAARASQVEALLAALPAPVANPKS